MGRPVRDRKLTTKGKVYTLQLLFADSRRVIKRLHNQQELFNDLLQSSNEEMLDREVAKLDSIHNNLLETYAQIQEIAEPDNEEFMKLVSTIDTEDSAVFNIKKKVATWMMEQANLSENSHVRQEAAGAHAMLIHLQDDRGDQEVSSLPDRIGLEVLTQFVPPNRMRQELLELANGQRLQV